ncbi:MAG TPA: rhodanese-like domain-containing protein [Thermoanaerobaculia bacterium]|nr:rhodanese-like domain-containing protein [Thermoanaerobaculia bacterium]
MIRRWMAALGLLVAVCLSAGCSTVGVENDRGFALVEPTVANEMILDNTRIVVLDLRPADEFYGPLGHVAGAISVPLGSIESRLGEILPYRSETVIVYADTLETGERGARLLTAAGFRNIVLIRGGIRRWIELGYKTVRAQ